MAEKYVRCLVLGGKNASADMPRAFIFADNYRLHVTNRNGRLFIIYREYSLPTAMTQDARKAEQAHLADSRFIELFDGAFPSGKSKMRLADGTILYTDSEMLARDSYVKLGKQREAGDTGRRVVREVLGRKKGVLLKNEGCGRADTKTV